MSGSEKDVSEMTRIYRVELFLVGLFANWMIVLITTRLGNKLLTLSEQETRQGSARHVLRLPLAFRRHILPAAARNC
jgi:hypothetical protein